MAETTAEPRRHATVIGAGIVGVCCALYLQREGFRVTLVERDAPGEGCSFGNAGSIGIASFAPYSLPGMIWRVPRLLLDPREPLFVRWRYLPKCASSDHLGQIALQISGGHCQTKLG